MSHNVIVYDTYLMITSDINSLMCVNTLQRKGVAVQEK